MKSTREEFDKRTAEAWELYALCLGRLGELKMSEPVVYLVGAGCNGTPLGTTSEVVKQKGLNLALPNFPRDQFGFPGLDHYRDRFLQDGVDPEKILPLELMRKDGLICAMEAISLVSQALRLGWKEIALTGSPTVMVRAWLLTASAAHRQYPGLRVRVLEPGNLSDTPRERELVRKSMGCGEILSLGELAAYLKS